jgi:hypothetical protein
VPLTDSADNWASWHGESLDAAAQFETVWSELVPRFAHLTRA